MKVNTCCSFITLQADIKFNGFLTKVKEQAKALATNQLEYPDKVFRRLSIVFYIISSLVVTSVTAFSQTPFENLGSMNGIEVSGKELQREMRRYRFMAFSKTSQTDKQLRPIIFLRNLALDSLVKIKVQEKLLRERNIWPYKSYSDFISDFHRTNELRKKALVNKQVVYGPVEYSEETFFDYRFSNALIQLKQQLLSEKVIVITDEELENQFKVMQKTHYAKEKYTLKAYERQVKEARVETEYAMLVDKHYKKAIRNIDQSKLNTIHTY